jgi:hypothetical protein
MSKSTLWKKSALVYVPIFFENLVKFIGAGFTVARPNKVSISALSIQLLDGSHQYDLKPGATPEFITPYPADGMNQLPYFSVGDLGKIVEAICQDPTKFYSTLVQSVSEFWNSDDYISTWGQVERMNHMNYTNP